MNTILNNELLMNKFLMNELLMNKFLMKEILIYEEVLDPGHCVDRAMAETDDVALAPALSWDLSPDIQRVAGGLLKVISDKLNQDTSVCDVTVGPATTEVRGRASLPPYVSGTARQLQVHSLDNAFYRLMPPDRIIYFDVDTVSFRRNRIPDWLTRLIVRAAQRVALHINNHNLGIRFAYRPGYNHAVFNIFCDPHLDPNVLAQSFFPSDAPAIWRLSVTSNLQALYHERDNMANILAHEFAHILGLRHWNAETCPTEIDDASFRWPGTQEVSIDSVMITGVPHNMVRFSPEDLRVIREIYSLNNGDVVDGQQVIDVYL